LIFEVNYTESTSLFLNRLFGIKSLFTLPSPPCEQGGSKQLNIDLHHFSSADRYPTFFGQLSKNDDQRFLNSEVNLKESHLKKRLS
jgi:hypothetical protein